MLRLTLLALVLALAGVTSGTAAVQTRALVSYTQTGGFAGKRAALTIYRDGTAESSNGAFRLSARRLLAVESALTRARFATLRREYVPVDPVADGFLDSVTYRGKTVSVAQGAHPPLRLQRVLDLLTGVLSRRG
jgi:hypothetical protein